MQLILIRRNDDAALTVNIDTSDVAVTNPVGKNNANSKVKTYTTDIKIGLITKENKDTEYKTTNSIVNIVSDYLCFAHISSWFQ